MRSLRRWHQDFAFIRSSSAALSVRSTPGCTPMPRKTGIGGASEAGRVTPCQWASKMAHFWALKMAHIRGEIHRGFGRLSPFVAIGL